MSVMNSLLSNIIDVTTPPAKQLHFADFPAKDTAGLLALVRQLK